jgi:hypothetical protein
MPQSGESGSGIATEGDAHVSRKLHIVSTLAILVTSVGLAALGGLAAT